MVYRGRLLCDSASCESDAMLLAVLVYSQADDLKGWMAPMDALLLLFSGVAVTVVLPCLIASALRDAAKRGAHSV
ncbi:hypothetical protein SAMN05444167_3822 [Terriglobus roseus]|uniref:Uncharacterized protein n=2 Tax=Terriglobus roseus TaxID=392734 RepID=A0A1G7QBE7_9BACT|nr:hypothetical protein SAMN05444167_3822 [Terriglobus roseus]